MVLLLIPDNISIKEESTNVVDVGVNFYDKSKFGNNVIHKSKAGVDWIFSGNRDKQKNLPRIFEDGDFLNTHNPFKINKILYDNNNSLNDEEYEQEVINYYRYYILIILNKHE